MDVFEQMFGMSRGGGGQGGPRKPKPKGVKVMCTLEDIYNGKEHEFELPRLVKCVKCNGVGGSDPTAVQTCSSCKGRGAKMMMRQLGPGMIT